MYPSFCSRVTTPSKLDPVAQAPCSITMVGLGVEELPSAGCAGLVVEAAAIALGMVIRAATAAPVRASRDLRARDFSGLRMGIAFR